jgi:hypothetical protein
MVYATTGTSANSATDTTWGTWTFRAYRISLAPRPMQRCLHYLFNLPCDAPKVELRRAYRRLAKIAHPDLNPGMGRWMTILNRSYEALEAA